MRKTRCPGRGADSARTLIENEGFVNQGVKGPSTPLLRFDGREGIKNYCPESLNVSNIARHKRQIIRFGRGRKQGVHNRGGPKSAHSPPLPRNVRVDRQNTSDESAFDINQPTVKSVGAPHVPSPQPFRPPADFAKRQHAQI